MKRNGNKKKKRPQSMVAALVAADRITCPRPPPITNNITTLKRFRYRFTSAINGSDITPARLCASVVMGTVLNTTAVQFYEQVRLISVEMWGPTDSSIGAAQEVAILPSGTTNGTLGSDKLVSDVGAGSTRIAHVKWTPTPQTQLSQWQSGATGGAGISVLFLLYGPNGTIVDVTMELRVTSNTRIANSTVVLATAVLGQIYYLALDNNAGGAGATSNAIVPMGSLITTT